MREAIFVPEYAAHKKDLENPCPCQDKPMKIRYKTGELLWVKRIGEFVREGEPVCEGEVEKATVEICSPRDGYLLEQCIADHGEFAYGDILGYIGDEPPQRG